MIDEENYMVPGQEMAQAQRRGNNRDDRPLPSKQRGMGGPQKGPNARGGPAQKRQPPPSYGMGGGHDFTDPVENLNYVA